MLFAPSVTNSYGGAVFPGIQDCVVYAKDSGREEDWNEVRGGGGLQLLSQDTAQC